MLRAKAHPRLQGCGHLLVGFTHLRGRCAEGAGQVGGRWMSSSSIMCGTHKRTVSQCCKHVRPLSKTLSSPPPPPGLSLSPPSACLSKQGNRHTTHHDRCQALPLTWQAGL
jgi:hypothetical protein